MNGGRSRTLKSVKNAKFALLFYALYMVSQFFSRKIFLEYLGAEVLGLNTTVQNVLQFLNLAELGIGGAVAFVLYKPISLGDRAQIGEIVSLQGYFYRRVAWVILAASVAALSFFPWIFAKADVVGWYPYATFGVMLAGMLGTFAFNYRQVLLSADQKEYKILVPGQSIRLAKVVLQTVLIAAVPRVGYPAWLVLELLGSVAAIWAVDRNVSREYPWLDTDPRQGPRLRAKYPVVMVKTRQLFFHKIAAFALFYTTVPIIYAYSTLTAAAVYGNYMLIVSGVGALVNALYNSIQAGVGTLVAEGDRERIMGVFGEFFSSRFLLAAVVCYGVWALADPLVTLWVGGRYTLDTLSLALIVATMFIQLTRSTVDTFIAAYGLFQDVWAPVTEAVLNVGLSVLLGWFWGMPGILAGVLSSLAVIIVSWKPYMLFRRGFGLPVRRYAAMYAKHAAILAVVWVVVGWLEGVLERWSGIDPARSWGALIGYGAVLAAVFAGTMWALLFAFDRGMRNFTHRTLRVFLTEQP